MLKLRDVLRARKQLWGTTRIKTELWDKEYADGRWEHCDDTRGDCVYKYIEKYSKSGSILDLGSGSGNTGTELEQSAYDHYTGVELSGVAVQQATERAEISGRGDKNEYVQGNIHSYVPNRKYDVILFRESIYYVPRIKIKPMLNRYGDYLKEGGVFIVRMADRQAYQGIEKLIEREYKILDRYSGPLNAVVLVFG